MKAHKTLEKGKNKLNRSVSGRANFLVGHRGMVKNKLCNSINNISSLYLTFSPNVSGCILVANADKLLLDGLQ